MVWYSHLFENFPQFIVIHTVKHFGKVIKAEIGVFLEHSCFFHDPVDVGNLISGSSTFSKSSLNICKFMSQILLKYVHIPWKILKEMGIPNHLTCLLSNLYVAQEATVRNGHGTQTGSKLGKEYIKAVYCHPAYLTYMQSTS